jgi:ribosomal protein S24E
MAELINKEEHKLLGRTSITASISFEGATPARDKVRKEIAKLTGEKEDHVIIKKIKTHYGTQQALVEAAIYKNLDDAKLIENKSLIKKHSKEEAKKEE